MLNQNICYRKAGKVEEELLCEITVEMQSI
jgi:hypothetical protein